MRMEIIDVIVRRQAMRIDRSDFGSIIIDGKTYDHDVKIGLSGQVSKRKKKLSKRLYGTSHIISEAEADRLREGMRFDHHWHRPGGNVQLSPEAQAYFDKKGCKVLLQPTQEAIRSFNRSANGR